MPDILDSSDIGQQIREVNGWVAPVETPQEQRGPSADIGDMVRIASRGQEFFDRNRQLYDQLNSMEEARQSVAGLEESTWSAVARRLPFFGPGFQLGNTLQLGNAQQRIKDGTADKNDYFLVAQHERLGQIEQGRSVGGRIGQELLNIPGMVAENMAAGSVLGLAGRAPALSLGGRLAIGTGWTAAQTALSPTMWLPQMAERNVEEGRNAFDPRGIPPAFAMGMTQTAIFGSLGRFGNAITGAGVLPVAERLLVRTMAGMGEKQIIDALASGVSEVLPRAYRLQTGYGVLGAAYRGEWGDFWKQLAVDTATFAVFSGIHEVTHGPPRVLEGFERAMNGLERQGVSREEAGRQLGAIRDILIANPNLTRAEAMELADGAKEGPLREFARSLAEARPEYKPITPAAEPTQMPGFMRAGEVQLGQIPSGQAPEAATGLPGGPTRPGTAPFTPEQAAAALVAERAKVPTPNQAGGERQAGTAFNAVATPMVTPDQATVQTRRGPAPEGVATPFREAPQTVNMRELMAEPDLARARTAWQRQGERAPHGGFGDPAEFAPAEGKPEGPGFATWPPPENTTQGRLYAIHQRMLAGEQLKPNEVYDAVKLTKQERSVLASRIGEGMTLEETAAQPELIKRDGGQYTRERIRQLEEKAQEKFGIGESVAESQHEQEKIDHVVDRIEKMADMGPAPPLSGAKLPPLGSRRGRLVKRREQQAVAESGVDPDAYEHTARRKMSQNEILQGKLDEIGTRLMKAEESGRLTPKLEAELVAEFNAIREKVEGRPGQTERSAEGQPAQRGSRGSRTVLGEAERGLSSGPEVPPPGDQGQGGQGREALQGARPAETAGAGSQGVPANPPSPAGGGEAGGRVLDRPLGWEKWQPIQRAIWTKAKDPYIRANLERRFAGDRTLRDEVPALDPSFLEGDREAWEGAFGKRIVKKGGRDVSEVTEDMVTNGLIPPIPEGIHAEQHLFDLLAAHYIIDGENYANMAFAHQEYQRGTERLFQEFKAANPQATDAEIQRAVEGVLRESGESGSRDSLRKPAAEVIEESWAQEPESRQSAQAAGTSETAGSEGGGLRPAEPASAGGAGKPPIGAKPVAAGGTEPGRNDAVGGNGPIADKVGDFAFGHNAPPEPGKPPEQAWDITRQEAEEMYLDGRLRRFGGGQEGGGILGKAGDMLSRAWQSLKGTFRRTRDNLGELAGEMAPRTTRESQAAGESIAHHAAADVYAQRAAGYYSDLIMPGATDAQAREFGAAFLEMRFRHARTALWQKADQARREANGIRNPEERQAALDRAKELDDASRTVRTFVGRENSGMATEADYQRIIDSPEFKAMQERWRAQFVPKMEEFYRKAEGIEADDPINSLTQIPGLPINAKAILESDPKTPGSVMLGGGQGNLKNPQAKKLGFAREFTGSAEGYDIDLRAMIQNTISQSAKLATKAEMYRTLEREGLAQWGRQGERGVKLKGQDAKELPGVRPPKGTQEAEQGQISLYLHPDVYQEVRKVLAVDQPWSKIPGADLITKISLMSLVEGAAHSKNLLTFLFKPGVSVIELAKNFWKVMTSNPEAQKRLVDLAEIGAMKPKGMESAATEPSKWNPLKWMSRALDTLDSTMRLTADAAFDRLQRQGRVEGTETNRRDFINQLGQYNKKAQNSLVALLRETGIGPFATAGTNYTMQGLRALTFNPGVKATSAGQALGLRAETFLRQAAVLSIVPLVNFLLWKRVDGDDATPLGAIKTGNKNGLTSYFDLAALTGITRGARTAGLQAILEGVRSGKTAPQIADRAVRGMVGGIAHPAEGPIVQFGHIALTGENMIGQHVARRVDRTAESQSLANLWAAVLNANPLIGSITGASQETRPTQQPPSLEQRLWSMLGPYGLKFRESNQTPMRYVPAHTVPGHMTPTREELNRRRAVKKMLGQK